MSCDFIILKYEKDWSVGGGCVSEPCEPTKHCEIKKLEHPRDKGSSQISCQLDHNVPDEFKKCFWHKKGCDKFRL